MVPPSAKVASNSGTVVAASASGQSVSVQLSSRSVHAFTHEHFEQHISERLPRENRTLRQGNPVGTLAQEPGGT
eukprot:3298160-Pyramimonas_sp.AAC.1